MSRDMKAKLLSLLVFVAIFLPIAGATNFEISVDDPRECIQSRCGYSEGMDNC